MNRIEKSREILPCLAAACEAIGAETSGAGDGVTGAPGSPGTRQVNTAYFYSLLFTADNLRLVHIACHDKKAHIDFTCDTAKSTIESTVK